MNRPILEERSPPRKESLLVGGLSAGLVKGRFFRSVLTLGAGTASAQLLAIVFMPILTRLYSPADFGSFALFNACVNTLLPVVSFSYVVAILLPAEDSEAQELFYLCILLIVFTSLLFGMIGYAWGGFYFKNQPSGDFLLLLAVFALIISGVQQALTMLVTRHKFFSWLARNKLLVVSSIIGFQLLFSLVSKMPGLIAGAIAGNVVGIGALFCVARGNGLAEPRYAPNLSRGYELLKRYRGCSFYSSLGSFFDTLSVQLVPVLLAVHFQIEVVGAFAIASSIAMVPVSLLGRSIAQTFFGAAAGTKRDSNAVRNITRRLLLPLAGVALAMAACLTLLAPPLFPLIFGKDWELAGILVALLGPIFFFQFIANALSPVFVLLERTRALAAVQLGLLSASVLPLVVGPLYFTEPVSIFIAYSATQTAAYAVYVLSILRITGIMGSHLHAFRAGVH